MVKNEAANLERCLASARPFVDEIVVIDTGSTDGTQDIAQRFADIYDEIEWPNSFAIARNYTFERSTGDFIIVLDGDEYLPNPDHWAMIRAQLHDPLFGAARLQVRNLLPENQMLAADRAWQERVFRNHPLIRYTGRIHHQMETGLRAYLHQSGRQMRDLPAEIIHLGYALTKEAKLDKYRPRVALLLAEYDESPNEGHRAYYGFQLATLYMTLGQYEDAAEIFLQLAFEHLSPYNRYYSHLLAAQTGLMLSDANMVLFHSNAMLHMDRQEPMGYSMCALGLLRSGQIVNGMLMMIQAFHTQHRHGTTARFLINPAFLLVRLSRILRQAGLLQEANWLATEAERDTLAADRITVFLEQLTTHLVHLEQTAQAA